MNVTDHQPAGTGPRWARMDRDVAMRLATTEYERFLDLLRLLSQDDWTKATDCPRPVRPGPIWVDTPRRR